MLLQANHSTVHGGPYNPAAHEKDSPHGLETSLASAGCVKQQKCLHLLHSAYSYNHAPDAPALANVAKAGLLALLSDTAQATHMAPHSSMPPEMVMWRPALSAVKATKLSATTSATAHSANTMYLQAGSRRAGADGELADLVEQGLQCLHKCLSHPSVSQASRSTMPHTASCEAWLLPRPGGFRNSGTPSCGMPQPNLRYSHRARDVSSTKGNAVVSCHG